MAEEEVDFSKLKVPELRQELKKRGLSIEGKKNELVERLQLSVGDAALLDDALLDDAQDDIFGGEVLSEDILNETVIDTPPEVSKKRPSESEEDSKRHPKKIILNRKVVSDVPIEMSSPTDSLQTEADIPEKVIKVPGLTQQEKLEKRAARFGASAATESSKIEIKITTLPSSLKTNLPASADLEILKKRAERFGTVAPVLEKVELEEKKKRRMERFGSGGNLANTTKTSVLPSNNNSIDKKAQRAERFKITS